MFRKNKYGAKRIEIDGYKFASKAEASFYQLFKRNIAELQPKVYLTRARILYRPDFLMKNGNLVEVKGFETSTWKIKKRLYKAYATQNLEVWKLRRGQLFCVEIVVPTAEEK